MKRQELIKSKGYNVSRIQNELFRLVNEYLETNNKTRTEFAKELNVTKGYVSQILNGDFDFKLSKLVELSLAVGKVPEINFVSFEEANKKSPETKEFKIVYLKERSFDNKPKPINPRNSNFSEKENDVYIYKAAK